MICWWSTFRGWGNRLGQGEEERRDMVSAKDTTAGSLRELWNMKGTTELSYPEARDLYFCIPISVSLGYFWGQHFQRKVVLISWGQFSREMYICELLASHTHISCVMDVLTQERRSGRGPDSWHHYILHPPMKVLDYLERMAIVTKLESAPSSLPHLRSLASRQIRISLFLHCSFNPSGQYIC